MFAFEGVYLSHFMDFCCNFFPFLAFPSTLVKNLISAAGHIVTA
jgi:hypothetical protein